MPGDRITLATVPDFATAELLREVLSDGGIPNVDIRSAVGVIQLPRSSAVDYEVRVDDIDEADARRVLADFEEQSAQAASAQAADHIHTEDDPVAPANADLRQHKPWVLWGLVALVAITLLPFLVGILRIACR